MAEAEHHVQKPWMWVLAMVPVGFVAAVAGLFAIAVLANNFSAWVLLEKLRALDAEAEVVRAGWGVGNYGATGNNLDVMAYRIVKAEGVNVLRERYGGYLAGTVANGGDGMWESSIERPRVEILPLKEMDLRDWRIPREVREAAAEISAMEGVFVVYAVVRRAERGIDFRGY